MRARSRGFTLMEVLVAVAILALAATATLRLVVMSQKSLAEVRIQRELLDLSRSYQTKAIYGTLATSGEEEDLTWEIRPVTQELLGGLWKVRYRLLVMGHRDRRITLCIP